MNLVEATRRGFDGPGCFGRHMPQRWRSPRSVFYDPKQHRGPKHRRATGPGSYSERDIVIGNSLDAEAADPSLRLALCGHGHRTCFDNLLR